ncbi:hypothetical protein OHC33_002487 [Knufia fluminis]|uniref:MYND-type domain-containing protein n=1 Tax=Knufia fluminis TaxID=191047 RepID=A0AAN8EHM6_9EURO|nr:hypothetical protein OHC33_002487 [Knufia fluminis]
MSRDISPPLGYDVERPRVLDISYGRRYLGPEWQSLKHRCVVCNATNVKLLRCTECNAVRYCAREHQAQDRREHEWMCKRIRDDRDSLEKETEIFQLHAGRFGTTPSTGTYLNSRFELTDDLRVVNTLDSLTEAREHLFEMLRLSRLDGCGNDEAVPGLLLQLSEDQKCYDFIKFYARLSAEPAYDPEDLTKPFLNIHDADPYEPIHHLLYPPLRLTHLSALLLLKIRLLHDMNLVMMANILKHRLPAEVVDRIKTVGFLSSISFAHKDCAWKDLVNKFATVANAIKRLLVLIHKHNAYFLPTQLLYWNHIEKRALQYEKGSIEEMQFAHQYSYVSWQASGRDVIIVLCKWLGVSPDDITDSHDPRVIAVCEDQLRKQINQRVNELSQMPKDRCIYHVIRSGLCLQHKKRHAHSN